MELGPEGVKAQEVRMQQLKKEALERAARNKRVDVHEEMIDQVRVGNWSWLQVPLGGQASQQNHSAGHALVRQLPVVG